MIFRYKALLRDKIVRGVVDAVSEKDAAAFLKREGYFPIEIQMKKPLQFRMALFSRASGEDITQLTRQLAIMLNAGLTITESLAIVKDQSEISAGLRTAVTTILNEINGGKRFSEAIAHLPKEFDRLYVALVEAGEASGKLNEILMQLAEDREKQREFRGKVRSALVYPAVIILGVVLTVCILMIVVVPRMLDIYKDFSIELPTSTRMLIVVSNFFVQTWWAILIASMLGIYIGKKQLETPIGRYAFDTFVLRMPVIGKIVRIAELVVATRTLSILNNAGVLIIESLDIIQSIAGNGVFATAFRHVRGNVQKGMSIAQAMHKEHIFPPLLVQMTKVGEETGKLDEVLMRTSRFFESESEQAIKTMTTLIEPAVLVVLGILVAFVVLSVLAPIYSLTNSFG